MSAVIVPEGTVPANLTVVPVTGPTHPGGVEAELHSSIDGGKVPPPGSTVHVKVVPQTPLQEAVNVVV